MNGQKSQCDLSGSAICQETHQDTVARVGTGVSTLINFSKQRSHENLRKH